MLKELLINGFVTERELYQLRKYKEQFSEDSFYENLTYSIRINREIKERINEQYNVNISNESFFDVVYTLSKHFSIDAEKCLDYVCNMSDYVLENLLVQNYRIYKSRKNFAFNFF